jgi:hypothetical protein
MARSPSQAASKPGMKKTFPRLIRGLKRNEYRTRALYFEYTMELKLPQEEDGREPD